MRHRFVWLHRWLGLVMAGFLLLAGVTGTLLAWYHELDVALNPGLMQVAPPHDAARPLPPLQLRARVQAAFPTAWVHHVPLRDTPGEAAVFYLARAVDPATGQAAPVAQDQVFVDPYSGKVLGARQWGAWSAGVTHVMPIVYRLHYSLALGEVGQWVFGVVALLWTLDCFLGAWLTFPPRRRSAAGGTPRSWWARWWPAWHVRWGAGAHKRTFDLHRAGGLWPWAMLFVLAWSAVAFNLDQAVYRPVMGSVFAMQADPAGAAPRLPRPEAEPAMGWPAAMEAARRHLAVVARDKGFTVLGEDRVSYNARKGVLRLVVRSDRDIHEKYGQTGIYIDARSGALLGTRIPTGEAAGDTITTWIQTLHMAQVGGLPVRLLISVLGAVVAVLSMTGVLLWHRKRQAARSVRQRLTAGERALPA